MYRCVTYFVNRKEAKGYGKEEKQKETTQK